MSGSSCGREDWQCDINGAHAAALMNTETVFAFGHMDEVEKSDGQHIEDWRGSLSSFFSRMLSTFDFL